jgi:hypothetical protein
MHHTLIGKNVEPTPELQEYFEFRSRDTSRTHSHLFQPTRAAPGNVRKNLLCNDDWTCLGLHFPQHTPHVEERSLDLKDTIRRAFDQIIRLVGHFTSKLRGEHRCIAGTWGEVDL